jgi:MFS transporter, DHA1 family, multidrug resistance protein
LIHSKLFFLYFTVFVNIAGFSMIFPLMPFYAKEFNASALEIGFLAASHALAGFLTAPFIGGISDRFGRKPVMLIGILLSSVALVWMGYAQSLWMLLFARIFHGVISTAVIPTARAAAADVSSSEDRVAAMGKIGAAMGTGLLLGPAISSFLIGLWGIHSPFFVAAAVCVLNAISVGFFLKESLKVKAVKITFGNRLKDLSKMFLHLKTKAGLIFGVLFVWSFALSNLQVSIPLFASDMLNMKAEHIGYFFTALALISVSVQGYLLPKIVKIIGEKRTILLGLASMSFGLLLVPLVPSLYLLVLSYMFLGFGSALNRPTAEGVISRSSEM